ncbi:MAG: hypothetical protein VX899_24265 [Myxococcota bacterium]|nr:hypothetical protein [Myxococcota bacterium]
MLIQSHRPDRILPRELDQRLAEGWFRIGDSLFTCRAVWFEGVPRSALWIRLDVQENPPRKSQRKLLSRIHRRFRVEHGPLRLDQEKRDLYARYRLEASGTRAERLEAVLGGNRGQALFDTHEIRIYDGETLVAFSWYDLGDHSAESILGVYCPTYASHSLGYATMLLEVQALRERGTRFYYPGYVLPGAPEMDYKLRLGPVEYWDPDAWTWRPRDESGRILHVVEHSQRLLTEVSRWLAGGGVSARLVAYPGFELPSMQPSLSDGLAVPVMLHVPSEDDPGNPLVVTWSAEVGFSVQRCQAMVLIARRPDGEEVPHARRSFLQTEYVVGTADDPAEAAAVALREMD